MHPFLSLPKRLVREDPRPMDKRGSDEVNTIISRFIGGGRKIPDRIGDLDPAIVVAAWTAHGEPILGGLIVFDLAWLE